MSVSDGLPIYGGEDIEDYRKWVSDSTNWIRAAKRLLQSASVLWETVEKRIAEINVAVRPLLNEKTESVDAPDDLFEIPNSPAYRLLVGYAIENLLKAVHVRRQELTGRDVTDSDGSLVGLRKDHQLELFAAQVIGEGNLSGNDRLLLRRLALAINWAGRYPTGIERPDRFDWIHASGTGSDDAGEVRRLVDKILGIHDSLTPTKF